MLRLAGVTSRVIFLLLRPAALRKQVVESVPGSIEVLFHVFRESPQILKAARLCAPPLVGLRRSILRMCLRIAVKKSADHALVLCSMFLCLMLEKLDAVSGERDRDLDTFLSKRKRLGRRQKIANHFQSSQRFIRVFDLSAHKHSCPCARIRRRRCG